MRRPPIQSRLSQFAGGLVTARRIMRKGLQESHHPAPQAQRDLSFGWLVPVGLIQDRIDQKRRQRLVGPALLPVDISYSTAPADQMSVRASATSPLSCSGAM